MPGSPSDLCSARGFATCIRISGVFAFAVIAEMHSTVRLAHVDLISKSQNLNVHLLSLQSRIHNGY